MDGSSYACDTSCYCAEPDESRLIPNDSPARKFVERCRAWHDWLTESQRAATPGIVAVRISVDDSTHEPRFEPGQASNDDGGANVKPVSRAWYLLLLLPFVAMLWVGSYNKIEPTLWGFPFFYWYQLLWVPICAAVVGIVFLATRPGSE